MSEAAEPAPPQDTCGDLQDPGEGEQPQKIPVMPEPIVYNYKIAHADKKTSLMEVLKAAAEQGKRGFRIAHILQTGQNVYLVMEQKLFLVPEKQPDSGILVPR